VMRGEVSFPAPAVLGHEISGEVVELGPDVPADGAKVGQQVVGAFIMPCGSCLLGDSHAHGTEGFHFLTRGKVVTTRWLDPSHGGINLGFPQNAQGRCARRRAVMRDLEYLDARRPGWDPAVLRGEPRHHAGRRASGTALSVW
jgi:Alcohol dehydrogenase GroES-like domain